LSSYSLIKMFNDRKDAGKNLALSLKKYRDKNILVLAIPRGGVEIGYEVGKYLNADLSLLISRKLPLPHNPEAGFGAIAEDGSTFIFTYTGLGLSKEQIDQIKEEQKQEIKRRIKVLRGGKPLPKIAGRTIILVDDGIAMGSTMRVAIILCKNQIALRIVVAVPVSGRRVAGEIGNLVDELIVLEQPIFFHAVAQVYKNWYDVSDEEVIEIMNRYKKHRKDRPN